MGARGCGDRLFQCTEPSALLQHHPRRSAKISSSRMTERLYYTDAYLRDFTASVVDQSADGAHRLPRPHGLLSDLRRAAVRHRSIGGAAVLEVIDEEDRVAHRLASPVRRDRSIARSTGGGATTTCSSTRDSTCISAVFEELFALRTVSFHLGAESATIDVEGAPVDARTLLDVERRANEIVYENRPVGVRFENAAEAQGLAQTVGPRRHAAHRLDRRARPQRLRRHPRSRHRRDRGRSCCARRRRSGRRRASSFCAARARCGGPAPIMRRCRKRRSSFPSVSTRCRQPSRRNSKRRAPRRRRARSSNSIWPAYRGRELYERPRRAPTAYGALRSGWNAEVWRNCALWRKTSRRRRRPCLSATLAEPPSVLLATSADSGIDAGQILKAALQAVGGRGGGTARMAQGSVPDAAALAAFWRRSGRRARALGSTFSFWRARDGRAGCRAAFRSVPAGSSPGHLRPFRGRRPRIAPRYSPGGR